MAGESQKWVILVATAWIQAFTATNFDFSAYSSELKAAMGISQVQLSYLATASDLGKALGWSAGLALLYLPIPAVLGFAAAIGLAAYGAQWLLITSRISLAYLPVFVLCLLAGSSICWFNTVCFTLCTRSFPANYSLALSLTLSFNGVSAALYTLVANALGGSPSTYLLLNAILPVLISAAALFPILRQPPDHLLLLSPDAVRRDTHVFFFHHLLAFLTGLYLLFLYPASSNRCTAWDLLASAAALLVLALCIPRLVRAGDSACHTFFEIDKASFLLDGPMDDEELEEHEKFIGTTESNFSNKASSSDKLQEIILKEERGLLQRFYRRCDGLMEKDKIVVLGEEHSVKKLVSRIDFWLYYVTYFCGATVGLVYSNNLGQIIQSLGRESDTSMLVTIFSTCSFFGRLVSAAPEFLHGKVNFPRTGWLAIALVPMPAAFFLLAAARDGHALLAGSALVGLSSGFIFTMAVSVSSELFGPNNLGVNHNILITNIPLGSLLYGLLAAAVYDANGDLTTHGGSNADGSSEFMDDLLGDGMVVCMGRKCYTTTFLWWGCITLVGLASNVALFLRTRTAYEPSGRGRSRILLNSDDEDFR